MLNLLGILAALQQDSSRAEVVVYLCANRKPGVVVAENTQTQGEGAELRPTQSCGSSHWQQRESEKNAQVFHRTDSTSFYQASALRFTYENSGIIIIIISPSLLL